MAKVPPPDRGQPLDVTYIYTLATALNEVADSVSNAVYNYTSVDVRGIGKQDLKNNNARIYAGYVDVVNSETVTANTTRGFSLNLGSTFKYPPIVVATPYNTGNTGDTAVGNDVLVTLTSVTASKIDGVVRFNSSGSGVSISVNILAIGVPA
jgi:hypothetical protein